MKTTARICTVLLAAVLLAACRPQDIKEPPDEVTVQLKWMHQAQFGGFYAAEQQGYYAEEGLAVSFIEGGPEIDLLAPVVEGRAQFGITAADSLLLARAEGKPVQAIATIYRRNPLVFVTEAGSGISRPEDFVAKNVLAASPTLPALRAMMSKVGVAPDQYTVLNLPYDVALFAPGQAPIWAVYLTGSIQILEQAGYELNVIYPDEYGVHFYADTLFTTDDVIASDPELVTHFLRATLRGLRYAIENPEAIGPLTLQYDETLDPARQIAQMEASVPLIHTGQGQIGWMRAEIWQGMHDLLLEQGLLEEPVDVNEAYTMEFLEHVYGGDE